MTVTDLKHFNTRLEAIEHVERKEGYVFIGGIGEKEYQGHVGRLVVIFANADDKSTRASVGIFDRKTKEPLLDDGGFGLQKEYPLSVLYPLENDMSTPV